MIDKERERERAEHVFRHMRDGGWGVAHLRARKPDMPFLLKDSGKRITCTDRIRDMAQCYYSELFAQPDPRFLEADVQLERRITEDEPDRMHDARATFSI